MHILTGQLDTHLAGMDSDVISLMVGGGGGGGGC